MKNFNTAVMHVCVLGSNGFIGQNLLRGTDWLGVTRQYLDLTDQKAVDAFFDQSEPFDAVVHCAVVGGSRLKSDDGEVLYKNILMFENVVRHLGKIKRLVYFSSGAALRGDPPTDPYGLSKWMIDRRIETLGPNVYSLRIWGCYGPGELPTRFSAVCRATGHVVIQQDRYFDFIDVEDVKKIVEQYCSSGGEKYKNLVYPEKKKLSEWAEVFGATYTVLEPGLDTSYVST